MQHLDPESLSLLALGEAIGDDAADHLRACAGCAAEFSGLRRAVLAAKPGPAIVALEPPGPQVWAGIHGVLGLSDAVAADPLWSAPTPGSRAVAATEPPPAHGSVTPFPSRAESTGEQQKGGWRFGRIRRSGMWLAAAAATALLAGGAFWSVQQNQSAVTPLARAELTPVDRHSATGSARVVEAKDGQRTLEVQVDKNEARGYQEVWLIAPDLSRLVSLGVMTAGSGTFSVPEGLDLAEYPIVDVSDEPVDGNPAHSSVSIVRGTLAL